MPLSLCSSKDEGRRRVDPVSHGPGCIAVFFVEGGACASPDFLEPTVVASPVFLSFEPARPKLAFFARSLVGAWGIFSPEEIKVSVRLKASPSGVLKPGLVLHGRRGSQPSCASPSFLLSHVRVLSHRGVSYATPLPLNRSLPPSARTPFDPSAPGFFVPGVKSHRPSVAYAPRSPTLAKRLFGRAPSGGCTPGEAARFRLELLVGAIFFRSPESPT